MAFILLILALMLIAVALRNQQGNFFAQLGSDIPGFTKWFLAILLIGLLGYLPGLQTPSRLLLALVVVVILLANQGFYQQLISTFQNLPSPAAAIPTVTANLGSAPVAITFGLGSAASTSGTGTAASAANATNGAASAATGTASSGATDILSGLTGGLL